MAVTPHTRKEDDRLRKELENADLEKFKRIMKPMLFPKKKRENKEK